MRVSQQDIAGAVGVAIHHVIAVRALEMFPTSKCRVQLPALATRLGCVRLIDDLYEASRSPSPLQQRLLEAIVRPREHLARRLRANPSLCPHDHLARLKLGQQHEVVGDGFFTLVKTLVGAKTRTLMTSHPQLFDRDRKYILP